MAAVDYFLKLDGVPGESQDSKHSNEIELESWNWGQTNSGSHNTGGGGGAGKVNMQDFSFTMKTNKASPKLFLKCATGEHISTAALTCRKAGKDQQEYLKIKFTNVLVTSHQIGGSAGSDIIPSDQISMSFEKIEFTYAPQKKDGSLDSPVVHNYDTKQNTGG